MPNIFRPLCLFFLCASSQAATSIDFDAFRQLLQTDTVFNRTALHKTLGIDLPQHQCTFAPYLRPVPAFACVNEWHGSSLQLNFFSPENQGNATRGTLFYTFPAKPCLTLNQAEVAFARHFRFDPRVVEEPGWDGSLPRQHVYTDYTDIGLKTYRIGLAIPREKPRCVAELRIELVE